MSIAVELLEGWIDTATTNGVCWRSRSALVVVVLHFPLLETLVEVLRSRRSTDLTEDEADALWTQVCVALDLLALHVPSSVAHNPLDGVGV
jgi:hypothetical protein